jgi:FdhD protein
MPDERITRRPVTRVTGRLRERFEDAVATERALELRVDGRTLSVTLRTPGNDEELVLGFLAAEALIGSRDDVIGIASRAASCTDEPDVVDVALAPGIKLDWARLERHFTATAACGLCGRAHLDALRAGLAPAPTVPALTAGALASLSERARAAQATFEATGALHAAALAEGPELAIAVLREDVGRHNAVDKAVGRAVMDRQPLADAILLVSGRTSFEILQKAAVAGVPIVAAVSGPTTLAIATAEEFHITLVNFLRDGGMNVATRPERIVEG